MGKHTTKECPTCGHSVITYERKFNSGMAASLILLRAATRRSINGWLHLPNDLTNQEIRIVMKGREYARLRFWGLLESRPRPEGGNASGEWKLTNHGITLADNPTWEIPRSVFEENSKVLGFSDGNTLPDGTVTVRNMVSLLNALEDDFNYAELVREAS